MISFEIPQDDPQGPYSRRTGSAARDLVLKNKLSADVLEEAARQFLLQLFRPEAREKALELAASYLESEGDCSPEEARHAAQAASELAEGRIRMERLIEDRAPWGQTLRAAAWMLENGECGPTIKDALTAAEQCKDPGQLAWALLRPQLPLAPDGLAALLESPRTGGRAALLLRQVAEQTEATGTAAGKTEIEALESRS